MDRERASGLVREIGAEVVRGTDFAANPWETIVVVADYHGRRSLFGYWFSEDDWEAATPDGFRALLLFGDLRDAMTGPGHAPWEKALMRIRRGGDPGIEAGIEVELEFDDTGERWVPTPADPEGFARGLLEP